MNNSVKIQPHYEPHGFPVVSLSHIYHVGTMNPKNKRPNSLEGAGLSVSNQPKAWRKINNRTAGDTFCLTKDENRFLDYHNMRTVQLYRIILWGLDQQLIEPAYLYKIEFYDDDDNESYMLTHDLDKAKQEAEYLDKYAIRPVDSYKSTALLEERSLATTTLYEPLSELAVLYAEDILGIDGVWWDDTLDIAAYSAPRGVIVNSQLPTWTHRKANGEK